MLSRDDAVDQAVQIILPKRMYGTLESIAAKAGMTRQQLDYYANKEIVRRLATRGMDPGRTPGARAPGTEAHGQGRSEAPEPTTDPQGGGHAAQKRGTR